MYIVDEENKVKHETLLDLSSLLMGVSGPQSVPFVLTQYSHFNDKLPVIEIEQLRITITSSK